LIRLSVVIFQGHKLFEVTQKIFERVLEVIIRSQISIDDIQLGYMPGRGTNDAIFILHLLQEKHVSKRKDLRIAFRRPLTASQGQFYCGLCVNWALLSGL